MIGRRKLIVGTCCVAAAHALPLAAIGGLIGTGNAKAGDLPAEIGGVKIPDSALAKEITALVRSVSPPPLFNHLTRTFVFGSKLGQAKGMKFDPELLFLAAMMHDLGLIDQYMGAARFEIDGADAAAKILREHKYPEARIDIAWEAIALHSTMEIPERRRPEVALIHLGVFMEAGMNADKLPAKFFDEVFETVPQLGARAGFVQALTHVLTKKPHTAYLAFEKDIALRNVPGFDPTNWLDEKWPAPFDR